MQTMTTSFITVVVHGDGESVAGESGQTPMSSWSSAASGFSLGLFGGLRQPGAPLGGLVLLAPVLVELDHPLGGLRQARLAGRWDLGLAGLHALVARENEPL